MFHRSTCANAVLVAALGLWGCTGSVAGGRSDSPDDVIPDDPAHPNTGAGGHAAHDPNPGGAGTPGAVAEVPGRTPLRRLTHAEYNNTIQDLLGLAGDFAGAFAGDEEAGGFASNTASPVSEDQAEQYHTAAAGIASKAVAAGLTKLAPCASATAGDACADQFIRGFGRRAFRRPLTTEEVARYKTVYTAGTAGADFAGGVELVITAMLESANFLYLPEIGDRTGGAKGALPLDRYETAARLSYFLIGSMPDDELATAADMGALGTAEQIAAQGKRLLASPRAARSIASFYEQWLEMADLSTTDKDPVLFPKYTPTLRQAMNDELRAFSSRATLEGDGKLTTILGAGFSYPNAELATLYGLPASTGADGKKQVMFPKGQRAGLLTLAAVMSLYAQPDQTRPVGRGFLVADKLLCATPPPPPNNVVPKLPAPDPNVTTRERLEMHRANPTCASCHALFDPFGLTFEIYDPIGAYRSMDGKKAVDASGKDLPQGFADVKDATGLMAELAQSDAVRDCLVKQWFRYAFGRMDQDQDEATLAFAREAFAKADFGVRDLLVGIAQSRGFRYRLMPQ
jgi:hypothetical protein